MKKLIIIFSLSLVIFTTPLVTLNAENDDGNYNYDYFEKVIDSPPAYQHETTITADKIGVNNFVRLVDVEMTENLIYILDEALGLFVVTHDYELLHHITTFETSENANDTFRNPSSITVRGDYIYIADTRNERVVMFTHITEGAYDENHLAFANMFYLPDNVPGMGDIPFRPLEIEVDRSGRIYVIARDIYEGLMEFDFEGDFKQYVGTNEVEINMIEYFWRQFVSQEARESMQLYLPVVFTSLAVDHSGFIYTTTESVESNPIQKLNFRGEDILVQNGHIPVIGDVNLDDDEPTSSFSSIDINDYGIYIALDDQRNRIFGYNDSGELLYIIGNEGRNNLTFDYPVDIGWYEDKIFVVDQSFNSIEILTPTKYGQNVNEAVKYYYQGDFVTSRTYWEEVLKMNTNFDLAYVGIGKVFYQNDDYEEAVEYFRLGSNKFEYSRAYEYYRNDRLRENFGYIFTGTVVVMIAISWRMRRR